MGETEPREPTQRYSYFLEFYFTFVKVLDDSTVAVTTGRIQCEVLTTLPFCFSWIKKCLGQQSKIWDDSSVQKLFR